MMESSRGRSGSDEGTIKVLKYCRVVDYDPLRRIHWSYVSVTQLRRHLELLNAWGFTPITFSDYLLARKGELRLPRKPVILTFDNGYRSTHWIAFPLLKQFGINAVVFALGDRTKRTDEWNRRQGLSPEQLLFDEELIEMHEAGFEIGSHSMSHKDLTCLPECEASREVTLSKETLESIIQAPVSSFSYPFGAVNEHVKEIVARAGYEFACGPDSGSRKVRADQFTIRRICVTGSTNSVSFALRMLTSYEKSEWVDSKRSGNIDAASTEGMPFGGYRAKNGRHGTTHSGIQG